MIKVVYDDYRGERCYRSLEELFMENLELGYIDFLKLTNSYVKLLETYNNKHNKQLAEADLPLVEVAMPSKSISTKFVKDSAIRYLVKYERYKTAPIWKELLKVVEENNINLNGDFFVDLYKEEK